MVVKAFDYVGIELEFLGKGVHEKAIVKKACNNNQNYIFRYWQKVLSIDSNYYRPTEVDYLIGDPKKQRKVGWIPEYDLTLW